MDVAVYLPLLSSALLAVSSPPLARRLAPATAARLLAGGAVVTAGATGFVLTVVGFIFLSQIPLVAAAGHWSAEALSAGQPVPDAGAVVALIAVCLSAVTLGRTALSRARAVMAARALCQHLGGGPGELVIVDDDHLDAFALPVHGGRVIVSRPLLASLPAAERRALLAHEQAHLQHHHHAYRLSVDLAAALNPLLRPVVTAVHHATERWADEAAAAVVGNREIVAAALARSSLCRHSISAVPDEPWAPAALAMAGAPVMARVHALLLPAPRSRRAPLLALITMVAVTLAATGYVQQDTEQLFERSMTPTSTAVTPLDR